MKILHFISNFSNAAGQSAVAVQAMLLSTSKVAENHLLTCSQLTEDQIKALLERNVHTHIMKRNEGKSPIAFMKRMGEVAKVLKEVQPDIVHVHGAWNSLAALVERVARHNCFVTVVSPHRGLSPEMLSIDFWKQKLPRLIAYQVWMIRGCVSVIALSEKEATQISNTGLKKRIEILPEIPKDVEAMQPFAMALMAAYRKALDSMYHRNLTKEEQQFVFNMVRVATVEDATMEEMGIQKADIKASMENASFRRIFFHAYDEDATQLMLKGVEKLSLTIPPVLDVANIPRYKNRKAKKLGPLAEANIKHGSKLAIPEANDAERKAVGLILNTKKIGMKHITLSQWVELYMLFRHTDFNEDIVSVELKRLGIKRFTKKLQKRLAADFSLKEGYNIY